MAEPWKSSQRWQRESCSHRCCLITDTHRQAQTKQTERKSRTMWLYEEPKSTENTPPHISKVGITWIKGITTADVPPSVCKGDGSVPSGCEFPLYKCQYARDRAMQLVHHGERCRCRRTAVSLTVNNKAREASRSSHWLHRWRDLTARECEGHSPRDASPHK